MDLRSEIVDLLAGIPIDFGGGCSASKAYLLASLICTLDLKASLDIGVYRGRSLLPQALAHRRCTGGVAYGIDPSSKSEARERDHPALRAEIDRFVEATDFDAIQREVERLRLVAGLARHCAILRMTSSAAAARFRAQGTTFGLVHVDGNHDTAAVLQDVRDFEPLLLPGGIVVMDDVSWDSVRPACELLASAMPRLFRRTDGANDYAVFWKVGAPPAVPPAWHALFREEYVVAG